MSKLAIVIPAYKNMYIEKAVRSIASQTCKDFTLYIGDDASPYDLESIVEPFKKEINIVYTKFHENIGGKNLVVQWERCIDLAQSEEWIWLFSDDDVMDKNCVESFYKGLSTYPDLDVFHFNVTTINHTGDSISSFNFPEMLTCEEYFYGRYQLGFHSFVIENIFRKSHFIEMGKFEHFDLGWGSDDALWIKLSKRKGIKTLDDARVFWRKSPYNISPNYKDINILKRKFYSRIAFAGWAVKQAGSHNIQIEAVKLQQMLERVFIENLQDACDTLSFKMIDELLSAFYRVFNEGKLINRKRRYIYIYKVYRFFIGKIKRVIGVNTNG